MRKLMMVLAIVAVLAMAGTSFATVKLVTERLADPAPGLWSFLLKAVSDEGDINTVTNPMLYGGSTLGKVHQCYASNQALKTTLLATINAGLEEDPELPGESGWGYDHGWDAQNTAADTHLILWPTAEGFLEFGANRLKENTIATADRNLYGLNRTGDGGGSVTTGLATWAKITSTAAYDYTVAVANDVSVEPPIDRDGPVLIIAQVVLPYEKSVLFSGRILGANVNPVEFTDYLVPEPSSIVMLILGGLCLIGYRFRR